MKKLKRFASLFIEKIKTAHVYITETAPLLMLFAIIPPIVIAQIPIVAILPVMWLLSIYGIISTHNNTGIAKISNAIYTAFVPVIPVIVLLLITFTMHKETDTIKPDKIVRTKSTLWILHDDNLAKTNKAFFYNSEDNTLLMCHNKSYNVYGQIYSNSYTVCKK